MDAVIFDCDGVLVDSEVLALHVLERELALLMPTIDAAPLLQNTAGTSTADILAMIERRTGQTLPPGTVPKIIDAIDQALDEELEPIPGAREAIERIPTLKAVASNSSLASVRRSVARAGLTGYFGERMFSADMVAKPKPAPDLYRYAAERLGVSPARCLVVEDSVPGTTAAHAAGMTVIGFTGASHVPPDQEQQLYRAGATLVIDRMDGLAERVNGWL
ncbi:MAG: HAD family hydrolase [Candidatus Competibacteraceae bacterium]|nr:HAD family hydrolase [Candidatus Competibacteraceae bacterium]